MKFRFEYSEEKNQLLKETRGIGFDEIIQIVEKNKTLDEYKHPNTKKYPDQRVFIVCINSYVFAVPYVRNDKKKTIFLKTAYPSRSLTKKYLHKVKI